MTMKEISTDDGIPRTLITLDTPELQFLAEFIGDARDSDPFPVGGRPTHVALHTVNGKYFYDLITQAQREFWVEVLAATGPAT